MGDAPLFGYSAKRGYQSAKKPTHTPDIHSFIQQLNLQSSSVSQMITRIWHNSRPRKVGTLIWLTLNRGLPIGTWLQCMGISPSSKVCDIGIPESPQHCLFECLFVKRAWEAFKGVWQKWKASNKVTPSWPFILLGKGVFKCKDDPPGFHRYHVGGFSYIRQPFDILCSFILYFLWSKRCRKDFDDQYFSRKILHQA